MDRKENCESGQTGVVPTNRTSNLLTTTSSNKILHSIPDQKGTEEKTLMEHASNNDEQKSLIV